MPRQARIDAPGALHHIICRGIDRKKIFRDDRDRNNFLDRIGPILLDTSATCFAWALIPNHFHILLRTGSTPLATVMRRLLTGYAVSFNKRHRRHGHLFQNRYKSILCEEQPYLLELVRYIHLNPLRAGLVANVETLAAYPYSGHGMLMGKKTNDWQDAAYILSHFGKQPRSARRKYGEFVQEGILLGKRPEFAGGGLIRSLGGREAAKSLSSGIDRVKGDERILGSGDFVEKVLKNAGERLDRQEKLKAAGCDLDTLAKEVSVLFDISPAQIFTAGKYPVIVLARSLFCFWAVRELGVTATQVAKKLGLSQPAVSIAVKRGEKIAEEGKYKIERIL